MAFLKWLDFLIIFQVCLLALFLKQASPCASKHFEKPLDRFQLVNLHLTCNISAVFLPTILVHNVRLAVVNHVPRLLRLCMTQTRSPVELIFSSYPWTRTERAPRGGTRKEHPCMCLTCVDWLAFAGKVLMLPNHMECLNCLSICFSFWSGKLQKLGTPVAEFKMHSRKQGTFNALFFHVE